jgi:uncharacterized repeat protein (TIGR01451 family)
LLIGAYNSLYESLDDGATITEIGPGLRVNSSTTGGHMIDYGGMQAGVPNPDVFYAATDFPTSNSVAVRTSSAGPISIFTISGATVIRGVAMDPTNWSTAYAVDSNQVFQTINSGVGWADITGSLTVSDIRSVETAPGMVFVGTERGVFVYDTSLGVWNQLGYGLPNTPVWDLDYNDPDKILVAGTLGRSAWTVSLQGSIAVEKVANVDSAAVGDTITYTYTITNTGFVALSSVSALDDLLGPVTLGTTSLGVGATVTGTLSYVVQDSDLPGPIVNTVDVTGTPPSGPNVIASDSASVSLPGNPAIEVDKTASSDTVSVGALVTYTYRITNTGDVSLSSISAVDDVLGIVSLGATNLAPGISTSGTITYTVDETDLPGPLVNTVEITGTSHVGELVTAQDTYSVSLTSDPSIAIDKVANVDTATVGDTVTYTYIVTNTGNVSLSSITVFDDKLGNVTLGVTTLLPGASTGGTLDYVVAVTDLPGPISNTAVATGTPPVGADATAQVTVDVMVSEFYYIYLPLLLK